MGNGKSEMGTMSIEQDEIEKAEIGRRKMEDGKLA